MAGRQSQAHCLYTPVELSACSEQVNHRNSQLVPIHDAGSGQMPLVLVRISVRSVPLQPYIVVYDLHNMSCVP